jgi:hypothetical protein
MSYGIKMKEEYSAALIITGPRTNTTIESIQLFLADKIQNIITIGDGKIDLDAQAISNIAKEANALANAGKVLVFVNAHGINSQEYGGHALQMTNQGQLFQSSLLFSILKNSFSAPIDIIFTACNGKGALKDINNLANGSRIIIFSEENNSTYINNYIYALEAMNGIAYFSLDNFYDNYLSHLTLQENPVMVIAGEKTIDPALAANAQIGKSISNESRLYVHQNFGKNVCQEDIAC